MWDISLTASAAPSSYVSYCALSSNSVLPAKDITPIVEPDIVSVPEAPPISVLVKLISEGLLLEKFNKFGVVNLKPLAFS